MAVDWMQAARDALAKQFGGQSAFPEVPQYLQQRAQQTMSPTLPGAPITASPMTVGSLDRSAPFQSLSAPRTSAVQTAGFAPLEAFSDFATPQTPRTSFMQGGDGFNFGAPVRQAFNKGFQGLDQQPTGANAGQVGGMAGESGYALLDQHNNEINAAAAKYGVPANLLKSMINRESSGDWAANNYVYGGYRNDEMLPFVGIFRQTADSWGLDFDSMVGNKQAQIDGMAKIVSGLANQYGGFDNAIKVYFGGEQALNGGFTDENGLGSDYYYTQAKNLWTELDQKAGFSGNYDLPSFNAGDAGLGNNWVVQQALQYVGVGYSWGAIPGKNDNPWDTGWDCSGMTYFLNQKYGDGTLRQGSHYQYQQMQEQGKLFTDLSQLQPGDIVFADTGWYGGAGGNLNRAGHVGIYLGNGQMLHAANPSSGTIVSPISGYNIIGAAHQSFSGGGSGGGFNSGFNNPFRR